MFYNLGYSHALIFNSDGIKNAFNFSTSAQARFHFGANHMWFCNVGWVFDYYPVDRTLSPGGILGFGKNIIYQNRTFILNTNGILGQYKTLIPNDAHDIYFQVGISTTLNRVIKKQSDPNDNYWDNTDAIFMDNLDSAESYLDKNSKEKKQYYENNRINIEKRDSVKSLKDSIKKNLESRIQIQKNNVRFEIVGISGIAGLVYERNIYRNKFDFNLRAGILPFPYGAPSLNLGAVFTTNKYHINPIGIISITTIGGDDFSEFGPIPMISTGATFQFSKRWSVQVYHSSALSTGSEFPEFTLFWGGINLGYGF